MLEAGGRDLNLNPFIHIPPGFMKTRVDPSVNWMYQTEPSPNTGGRVVSDPTWRHPLCEAFIDGAVRLGIPRNDDYNGHQQIGVGYTQRTIHRRRRMSRLGRFCMPNMGSQGNCSNRPSSIMALAPPIPSSAGLENEQHLPFELSSCRQVLYRSEQHGGVPIVDELNGYFAEAPPSIKPSAARLHRIR